MEITIDYSDSVQLEILVGITRIGRFIPASRFQPEEWPEIEISVDAVWYKDKLVKNINPPNKELIYELVEEKINDLDQGEIY